MSPAQSRDRDRPVLRAGHDAARESRARPIGPLEAEISMRRTARRDDEQVADPVLRRPRGRAPRGVAGTLERDARRVPASVGAPCRPRTSKSARSAPPEPARRSCAPTRPGGWPAARRSSLLRPGGRPVVEEDPTGRCTVAESWPSRIETFRCAGGRPGRRRPSSRSRSGRRRGSVRACRHVDLRIGIRRRRAEVTLGRPQSSATQDRSRPSRTIGRRADPSASLRGFSHQSPLLPADFRVAARTGRRRPSGCGPTAWRGTSPGPRA